MFSKSLALSWPSFGLTGLADKALFWSAFVMAAMLILAGGFPVGYGATFAQHKVAAAIMVVGICLYI